jgi:hypothetical protein
MDNFPVVTPVAVLHQEADIQGETGEGESWHIYNIYIYIERESSWLQIRRPGFDSRHYQNKSSGSGTGCTQPREYNWGATW